MQLSELTAIVTRVVGAFPDRRIASVTNIGVDSVGVEVQDQGVTQRFVIDVAEIYCSKVVAPMPITGTDTKEPPKPTTVSTKPVQAAGLQEPLHGLMVHTKVVSAEEAEKIKAEYETPKKIRDIGPAQPRVDASELMAGLGAEPGAKVEKGSVSPTPPKAPAPPKLPAPPKVPTPVDTVAPVPVEVKPPVAEEPKQQDKNTGKKK